MLTDLNSFNQKSVYTLLRVWLFYILSVAILLFTSRLTKSLPTTIANLLSIALASLLTVGLVVVFARWEKLRLAYVGLKPGRQSANRFVTGYVIGASMAVMQACFVLLFGHLRLIFNPHMTAAEIGLSALLYLLVACREELVFRAYALRSLSYSMTSAIALLIILVIFISEHVLAGMGWTMALVGSGLGGLLFGISALKTRGLALPVGLHSAWNFGQWMMGFKNKNGIWEAVVEKGYEAKTETIGLVAFAGVMILAIAAVSLFYTGKNKLGRL
ncbi:CPBP family intramembrane glutamic endopeptidase [Spirosoma pollinicola]|uniref:CPBP family intramembrane metalloprotease n=1 Tax=Spirosoma pollinicola TaxID=2057025 RepID=A0A2K8YT61_9BACT|nr:CPBP family intramembrane glutamic endopeptidase [Spirosoma pollinicola]AUD00811.1 CPBP family intramembrane metalloprotease [Spirosoma pollinicola]